MEEERYEKYYDEYEIDLREYIKVLWDGKWLVIGLFIIAVLAAGIVSQYFMEPVYETKATIQLTNAGLLEDRNAKIQLKRETYSLKIDEIKKYNKPETVSRILRSNSLINPVIKALNPGYSSAELRNYIDNKIKVNIIEDSQIVNLRVKHNQPQLAQKIATGILNNFKEKADEYYKGFIDIQQDYLTVLNNEITNTEKKIKDVNENIENIYNSNLKPVEKSVLVSGLITRINSLEQQKRDLLKDKQEINKELLAYQPVKVLDSPYLPENPVSPNKKLNIAIAGVLALMLGVFIVFFQEFMKEEDNQEQSRNI